MPGSRQSGTALFAMHIEAIEISNFRRLKAVRIGISCERTVFVGANNSGKTSAMIALRRFLVERERSRISLHDLTLSHYPTIVSMGSRWDVARATDQELPVPDWSPILPFVDVWLHADKREAHFVQKLIPTLDWDGGRLGVRLRLEPKDATALQKDYLIARAEAHELERATRPTARKSRGKSSGEIVLWPRSLLEFLQRRFATLFTVRAYILDPAKLAEPTYGEARPQRLMDGAEPIDGEPFDRLIKVDEISAQRGFGPVDGAGNSAEDGTTHGPRSTRRMSEQLRRYWNRHLDPSERPDPKDIDALRAIAQAEQAFDARLRAGFAEAVTEIEGIGYPGVTDPRLKISTRLRPVDGLNHEAALQYVLEIKDGRNSIALALPEDSNGLGYQNLISMTFRLMSFRDAWVRVGKAASRSASESEALVPPLHVVLLEEPEAYLHTQVQQVFVRHAYRVLRNRAEIQDSHLRTQLIISTHSSHIAHECEFDELRYFRRIPAAGRNVPTSSVVDVGRIFSTDLATKRFAKRYIQVTHCDLFFADAAVLLEGTAEQLLLPFFVRNHPELQELSESYISWLEIGGSHAHRLRRLIEHLGLTTLIITDLDARGAENNAVPPKRHAGQKSGNPTLRLWWPREDDLDTLVSLDPDQKCKFYSDRGFSIRVAYQLPVSVTVNGKDTSALATTLEDALVLQNLSYFDGAQGTGLLGKFAATAAAATSIDDLSVRMFNILKGGGKAEFALALLEIDNPLELQPPEYILDGLRWLGHQVKARRKDLGLSLSSAMTSVSKELCS